MLNHQITEKFATFFSAENKPETIFKALKTKQPIKPTNLIEPIEINGIKLEFPNINALVK